MHRSRMLLFENPCVHSICSFDRRINHSYMRFYSIRCALLSHYNESSAFFLDLMRDLAHGAAQINPWVYFWSQGSYSLYNVTKFDKFGEKNSPNVRRLAFHNFVYLVNSSAIFPQKDTSKFTTIAVHSVDNLYFSCSLLYLRNAA